MEAYRDLQAQIEQYQERPAATAAESRALLLEIEDFISSDAYQELPPEMRQELQDARTGVIVRLEGRVDGGESTTENGQTQAGVEAENAETPKAGALPVEQGGNGGPQPTGPQEPARERNPVAEQQMDLAEKLFYSGRYADAIQLFDHVLQLEPNWERARQHRSEAENYLRTGYIPAVALPADAAAAYGKAQSAARVGRYQDALAMLEEAQRILRDLGIQRWQEGQEFAQKLRENIDAENVYEEGLELFAQGQVDEAIEAVEAAARATGLPKYTDRAKDLRQVKDTLRGILDMLNQATVEPQDASQAKANLDALVAEYGQNPAFDRVVERFRSVAPRVVEPLKEKARSLKNQAEQTATMEEALYLARQARQNLDQVRNLEGVDESLDRLQHEIEKLQREIERYDNDLQSAQRAYEGNPQWPSEAARLSAAVRERFPNDTGVIRLERNLRSYRWKRLGVQAGGVLGIVLILLLAGMWGRGRYRAYLLAQTPTVTPTPTMTATMTATATSTSTPTATLTPTATITPTPEPISGITQRDLWARAGCYESFTAVGKILAGNTVRFLPSERRFDDFNRECVLVEYRRGDGSAVIGWVLTMDLGAGPPPTATPE